jgi:hypothetical protein
VSKQGSKHELMMSDININNTIKILNKYKYLLWISVQSINSILPLKLTSLTMVNDLPQAHLFNNGRWTFLMVTSLTMVDEPPSTLPL